GGVVQALGNRDGLSLSEDGGCEVFLPPDADDDGVRSSSGRRRKLVRGGAEGPVGRGRRRRLTGRGQNRDDALEAAVGVDAEVAEPPVLAHAETPAGPKRPVQVGVECGGGELEPERPEAVVL
ncbi:unnamed protein product, partial [Discosporangium mesarthrocarpum]